MAISCIWFQAIFSSAPVLSSPYALLTHSSFLNMASFEGKVVSHLGAFLQKTTAF